VLALELLVVLAVTVLVGTTIGGRYRIAPPVLLILMGSAWGLVPALSAVELNPDYVLFLFLPAILYWESLNTSLREIRANLRVIVLSSVVLVIVTMVAVSYAAQALGVHPAAAWVLGAVLAPTDAAAVAGLAKRMPRRLLTNLRAESLINDGTALVLFAIAVGIGVGESPPSPPEVALRFVGSYAGGIVAGLLVGRLVIRILRHLDDPLREGALSVLTPFTAYLAAETVHASGVVAVVVAGLLLSYAGPRVIRARSRTQAFAFWNIFTFLLNGGLFVFVGLQVPRVARDIDSTTMPHALVVALAITGVVIGTRLLWVHVASFLLRAIDRRAVQRARRVHWRTRTAAGWAGFRGAVSFAAALAVPTAVGSGDFPDRDLIVFATAIVILLTIIVQGSTLPLVVRWARLPEDIARLQELELARATATQAALDALPRAAADIGVASETLERVRREYEERLESIHMVAEQAFGAGSGNGSDGASRPLRAPDQLRMLKLAVLDAKREAVTELRDANRIDDIVLREIQAALDAEEVRLLGPVTSD
jgi:CPA1 family monovalent cation:H+ antiporter